MPFVTKENREKVERYRKGEDIDTSDWAVGDWCYYYYKPMVDRWKVEPRWTTAHNIHAEMEFYTYIKTTNPNPDLNQGMKDVMKTTAYKLAWQVFFIKYVWEYERRKIIENGDI